MKVEPPEGDRMPITALNDEDGVLDTADASAVLDDADIMLEVRPGRWKRHRGRDHDGHLLDHGLGWSGQRPRRGHDLEDIGCAAPCCPDTAPSRHGRSPIWRAAPRAP